MTSIGSRKNAVWSRALPNTPKVRSSKGVRVTFEFPWGGAAIALALLLTASVVCCTAYKMFKAVEDIGAKHSQALDRATQ